MSALPYADTKAIRFKFITRVYGGLPYSFIHPSGTGVRFNSVFREQCDKPVQGLGRGVTV
ncbi:hypothetical protein SMBr_01920 [Shewanella sp. M-Br]|nr:hypothetical protein SMBr_01920 [Shewanella sp. M-Br]